MQRCWWEHRRREGHHFGQHECEWMVAHFNRLLPMQRGRGTPSLYGLIPIGHVTCWDYRSPQTAHWACGTGVTGGLTLHIASASACGRRCFPILDLHRWQSSRRCSQLRQAWGESWRLFKLGITARDSETQHWFALPEADLDDSDGPVVVHSLQRAKLVSRTISSHPSAERQGRWGPWRERKCDRRGVHNVGSTWHPGNHEKHFKHIDMLAEKDLGLHLSTGRHQRRRKVADCWQPFDGDWDGERWEPATLVAARPPQSPLLVSSLGRFLNRCADPPQWAWGTSVDSGGYLCIRGCKAHRIVATTFLGPEPAPGHTVDHINRDRQDNSAANLRWADQRQQSINQTRRSEHAHMRYLADLQSGQLGTAQDQLSCAEKALDGLRTTAPSLAVLLTPTDPARGMLRCQQRAAVVLHAAAGRDPLPDWQLLRLCSNVAPETLLGDLHKVLLVGIGVQNLQQGLGSVRAAELLRHLFVPPSLHRVLSDETWELPLADIVEMLQPHPAVAEVTALLEQSRLFELELAADGQRPRKPASPLRWCGSVRRVICEVARCYRCRAFRDAVAHLSEAELDLLPQPQLW